MLPKLAHWFGIYGADIADMPEDELSDLLALVEQLPPIGGNAEYVWERRQP